MEASSALNYGASCNPPSAKKSIRPIFISGKTNVPVNQVVNARAKRPVSPTYES